MIQNFSIARLPRIEFGAGSFKNLPALISQYGKRVLLVTGGGSFLASRNWHWFQAQLQNNGFGFEIVKVENEPSPDLVDNTAKQFKHDAFDVVVGIGGGSALDAAKAIAGLLCIDHSVMDFLEGVGPELDYPGPALPFIAVPTTAGTGSEATKNAVLSVQGDNGFKKSFRHDKLVAEYAVVDPELLITCPPALIAANGMDALTQLMESYTSLKANPMTDALAISGIRAARDSLLFWYEHASAEADITATARSQMAYASMLSGITLAQVGLGSVHGLASPLGAFFPIPHGVVCGTLLAEATRLNIDAMIQRQAENPGLARYARLAEVFCQQRIREPEIAWQMLVDKLHNWTQRMELERLGAYGIDEDHLDKIVQHSRGSSMKTNPIILHDAEIKQVLLKRL